MTEEGLPQKLVVFRFTLGLLEISDIFSLMGTCKTLREMILKSNVFWFYRYLGATHDQLKKKTRILGSTLRHLYGLEFVYHKVHTPKKWHRMFGPVTGRDILHCYLTADELLKVAGREEVDFLESEVWPLYPDIYNDSKNLLEMELKKSKVDQNRMRWIISLFALRKRNLPHTVNKCCHYFQHYHPTFNYQIILSYLLENRAQSCHQLSPNIGTLYEPTRSYFDEFLRLKIMDYFVRNRPNAIYEWETSFDQELKMEVEENQWEIKRHERKIQKAKKRIEMAEFLKNKFI